MLNVNRMERMAMIELQFFCLKFYFKYTQGNYLKKQVVLFNHMTVPFSSGDGQMAASLVIYC